MHNTKLSGRDAWVYRLEHLMDAEPEELEAQEATPKQLHGADGRALWLQRLRTLCDTWSRQYQREMSDHRTMVRNMKEY